ncbi:MAG: hypothetical protein LBQ06_07025, partial [Frankiaceae bacterium]|nr:hypothetical protein [Frankiaceae bacterium]
MFLISLGIILFAALVLRRLIGIRRGQWIPTLAAVVLGEAAALAVLDAITHRAIYLPWSWYPLGIGMVAAFSMLSLVIIEMIFPPRDHPRPFRLPRPFTAIRRTGGRGIRYTQVGAIALRKGLFGTGSDGDDMTGSRLGRSLASTFEDAGGLFVKLGQAMAAQPQLVTPAVAAALTRLNDQATPADPKASRSVIAEEIGEAEHVFAAFDPEPVAAASLAQTYFATLPDGRAVVVKVQRPGIRGSVERDLDILVRLAERLDRRTTWARSIGLSELVAGFAEATREELDYRIEAANGLAAREALADGDPIIVPAII